MTRTSVTTKLRFEVMNRARTLVSLATGLLAVLTVGSALTACGSNGTNGEFVANVVIPPENYAITDFACNPRQATAIVDGETVEEMQWWGQGTITNVLSSGSPNYDVRYNAVFADGETTEAGKGSLVFPLAAGESTDFSFLVMPVGPEPLECDVFLYDSALNYFDS